MDEFHWRLSECVESEFCGLYLTDSCNGDNGIVPESSPSAGTPSAGTPRNRVEYDIGSFLLVKHDGAAAAADRNLWVARVVEVFMSSSSNYANELRVHWYERTKKTDDGRDILQAAFNPCFVPQNRMRNKRTTKDPWLDTVHTDTVAVSFPSLTSRKTLPLAVQNKISRWNSFFLLT